VEDVLAELDQTRTALKAANRESADRRKRLEELEKKEQERASAELSELDKAKKAAADAVTRAEQAEAKAAETALRATVVSVAAQKGFIDPLDAYALMDRKDLDPTDDKDVATRLDVLAKAKPHLVSKTRVVAPGINPTNPNEPEPHKETDEERRARLYSGGGSFLSPDAARKQGGGVIFPETPKNTARG
jgi:multidrug efflux pump subunit AcrA (membrane-fusion protein)